MFFFNDDDDHTNENATAIDLKYLTLTLEDVKTTLMVVEVVLGTFIVLGNFLVLLLFYQNIKWLKISHRFIISLAVSDLLQGLINPAVHIYLVGGVKMVEPSCLYVMVLGSIIIMISLFVVFATCIDRYLAIVHPVMYKTKVTPAIANWIIGAAWVLGFLIGFGLIFMQREPDDPEMLCYIYTERFSHYYTLGVCFLIVLPANIGVAYAYVRIYKIIMEAMDSNSDESKLSKLRKIVLRVDEPSADRWINRDKRREIRTTIILLVTVLLYFVCWIPGITIVVLLMINPKRVRVHCLLMMYILTHINSAIDPFLYAYNLKGAKGVVRQFMKRAASQFSITGTPTSTRSSIGLNGTGCSSIASYSVTPTTPASMKAAGLAIIAFNNNAINVANNNRASASTPPGSTPPLSPARLKRPVSLPLFTSKLPTPPTQSTPSPLSTTN